MMKEDELQRCEVQYSLLGGKHAWSAHFDSVEKFTSSNCIRIDLPGLEELTGLSINPWDVCPDE